MKIKTIVKYLKPCDRWCDDSTEELTLVSIGATLSLGNNFTLEHLVTSIFETISNDDFERLYTSVSDSVIISYKTRFGKGKERLNGFDFNCYFKDEYNSI